MRLKGANGSSSSSSGDCGLSVSFFGGDVLSIHQKAWAEEPTNPATGNPKSR